MAPKNYERRHDLGRPSNVGSLIAAVMVAALGLVSGHYARLGARWFHEMSKPAPVAAQPPTATLPATKVKSPPAASPQLSYQSAATIGQGLDRIEKSLTIVLEHQHKGRPRNPSIDTLQQQAFAEVDRIREALAKLPKLVDELTTSQRLTQLRVYFMAAQLAPKRYTEPFTGLCDQLEHSQVNQERSQAAALRIYLQHDLNRPQVPQLMQAIEQFAQDRIDDPVAIELWSVMSHELWARGYHADAEQILRRGMKIHAGQPGISRLVNQMIDQKQPRKTR